MLRWCREHNVVVTAHTPLGRGRILGEPALINIGQCHSKTPGQVGLRWLVQQGMVVIPKASSEGHLKENMDVFDWSLSAEEMEQVSRLSERIREVNTFEDLINLSDREIQGMLRELNTRDLAVALNGASQAVQDRIFQNVTERVAGLIRDEIGSLGTVREQDVQVVRGRIVEIAREKLD